MDENTQAMYEQYMNDIRDLQTMNNNWSAEQAQIARDYEQSMSNSAHQREMEDLKKAGLNPILAAGGSGATTTSGNAAQRGDSNISAMATLMSKMLDASMAQSHASAVSAEAIQAEVEKSKVENNVSEGSFSSLGSSKDGSKGVVSNPYVLAKDPIASRTLGKEIHDAITLMNKNEVKLSKGSSGKRNELRSSSSAEQVQSNLGDIIFGDNPSRATSQLKLDILSYLLPGRVTAGLRKLYNHVPVVQWIMDHSADAFIAEALRNLFNR